MARIFLIGFMGSGKTTVGKQLASLLHYNFTDLDAYIEREEQATISQMFQQKGEAYFREREAHYLRTLVKQEQLVVATGGGSPCYFDNMKWMNDHGITVYLEASVKLLADRLGHEKTQRPLLKDKSDQELIEFIRQKLSERIIFYNTAQFTAASASLNARKLKQLIAQHL